MDRVKFKIWDNETYPDFSIEIREDGEYSLTKREIKEGERIVAAYEKWQSKLRALKPDAYIPPPPLTEEEKARREREWQYLNSTAYQIELQTTE